MDSLLAMFMAVPLGIYVALCVVPAGRLAAIACAAVILAALALFAAAPAGSIPAAHAPLAIAATILAGGLQVLRPRLGGDLRRSYGVAVALGFVVLGGLILQLLRA